MDLNLEKIKTKLGIFYIVASSESLLAILPEKAWKRSNYCRLKMRIKSNFLTRKAKKQLIEYFVGKRKEFELPTHAIGSEFQIKVWKNLCSTKYGQTVSYEDIAKSMKKPKSVRAIATAISKNPLCIAIPCHRVIRKDKSIGQYSGGANLKRHLIKIELGK